MTLTDLLGPAIVAAAAALGFVVSLAITASLRKLGGRSAREGLSSVARRLRRPFRILFPLVFARIALPLSPTPADIGATVSHVLGVGLIATVSWSIMKAFLVLEDVVVARYRLDVEDNLRARKVHTQIRYVSRIAVAVIAILALGLILLTFEGVQDVGATILASAGVAGIVIGIAAQRTLALILAGLQVALTQPIRTDDVLIIEGEWGRVEEVNLTYVVMRIWDLRRLVIPVNYFLEKPFQNWTRVSADLLGTVYLYVDYALDVSKLRPVLHQILTSTPLWDGKVWNIQVTDCSERTVEVRAMMSAADSPRLWDLRCLVRERLLAYIRDEHPEGLPQLRASMDPIAGRKEAE